MKKTSKADAVCITLATLGGLFVVIGVYAFKAELIGFLLTWMMCAAGIFTLVLGYVVGRVLEEKEADERRTCFKSDFDFELIDLRKEWMN